MKKTKKETEIVKDCKDYLEKCGLFVWRQNAGVIPTKNGGFRFSGLLGVSDILGIFPQICSHGTQGLLLAVECKTDDGKVSNHQKKFLDNVQKNGGIAIVARSKEDLEKQLSQYPKVI